MEGLKLNDVFPIWKITCRNKLDAKFFYDAIKHVFSTLAPEIHFPAVFSSNLDQTRMPVTFG